MWRTKHQIPGLRPAEAATVLRQSAISTPVVLVVDDHEDSRFIFKFLLEKRGYRVLEAGDGLEAIETARRERPSLVLLDVSLPNLDGLSVMRLMRGDNELRNTSVVIVSGHVLPEAQANASAAGCDAYLTKPVNFVQFDELLDRLLPVHPDAA